MLWLSKMEQFLSLLFIVLVISGLIYLSLRDYKKLNKYHRNAIVSLRKFSVDKSEAKFYRDSGGLWIETSQVDIEKQLRNACKTHVNSKCVILHEAKYCIDYDKENNSILIALGVEEFDFTKSNYYREWVKGNKEFNDRVNKAMGRL